MRYYKHNYNGGGCLANRVRQHFSYLIVCWWFLRTLASALFSQILIDSPLHGQKNSELIDKILYRYEKATLRFKHTWLCFIKVLCIAPYDGNKVVTTNLFYNIVSRAYSTLHSDGMWGHSRTRLQRCQNLVSKRQALWCYWLYILCWSWATNPYTYNNLSHRQKLILIIKPNE